MPDEEVLSQTDDPAPPPGGEPQSSSLDRVAAAWPRLDGFAYALFATICVAYASVAFYGYMHVQTSGVWSAPLDDVFIHFDYARATARGYPFEWTEGNGFSSGNTSLTYPFALALGYWAGFRDLHLMLWAALVACASVLVFLLAAGRLIEPAGRWAKYLLPPVVLSLGALDWSLFSGMENAFHLGTWGVAIFAAVALADARGDARRARRLGWLTGLAGALLVATRPESVVCVAALGFYAAYELRGRGRGAAVATLVRVGLPGVVLVVAQAIANKTLTGEWAANGAITKLAINNPYMTAEQKWDEYLSLLKYVVVRNTQHHFADVPPYGWLVPIVAAIPLAVRQLRPVALLLWAQVAGWLLLVSMNGQVRWQNERYTMAAVAWLLVLAALGLAALMRWAGETRGARVGWIARLVVACAIGVVYWQHQLPNMRDQIWFFGRASRNIRDQHLVAGRFLAELHPKRVLVGDAGALMYASDLPGLDLIGLGGYHDLPFARANVNGLGASLELLERLAPADRPDAMALYPTWWGDLPAVFGDRIIGVPVIGNVICGGAEKVIYRADWSSFEGSGAPRTLRPGEHVVDELDVADLVSEREHGYVFPHPSMGFISWRVLGDPVRRERDLFDAGRLIPQGQRETARMRAPGGPARLVIRTAAAHAAMIDVEIDGAKVGSLEIAAGGGWSEPSLELPSLPPSFDLALVAAKGEWWDHHVWLVARGEARAAQTGPP